MAFTQETFFGASIRNWQSSIGWEGNPSSCTVNVIVDPLNGDSFITPIIGMPATLQYQTWSFRGIVESYKRRNSSDANPEYEIRLVDPREILANAQVIVGSYTGGVLGVPNLYNVYGYYEALDGYGGSGWSEAGMPWSSVRSGLQALVAAAPLTFRGYQYIIDLSTLPNLSGNYSISGPSLSILDFISQVCQDGGHDFFVNLVGSIISIKTISRLAIPASFNEINAFVTYVGGQVSSEAGRELRNETTSKIVIGGQRKDMWFQTYNGEEAAFASIWPFWGFEKVGNYYNPIMGTGTGDAHNFTVDVSHLNLGGALYNIDVRELRAAGAGYEDWLFYLADKKASVLNALNIASNLRDGILSIQNNSINKNTATPLSLKTGSSMENQKAAAINGDSARYEDESALSLYRFVKQYAEEYYGRQFMVAIPSIGVRYIGNDIDTSKELEKSAWIDESAVGSYGSVIANRYLPDDFNKATESDGSFKCMVRIADADQYSFEVPLENLILTSRGDAFIECDPVGITFLDTELLIGPRAVIKLPGPITSQYVDDPNLLRKQLSELISSWSIANQVRMFTSPGSEQLRSALMPRAVLPDLALIPLRNKQLTYGPWVAIGAPGKVDVEINDDLVPWNYGSLSAVNAIGQASVNSSVTNMQEGESGNIEFPGVPETPLGVPITAGGPFVTDVSVSIGTQGATTRYTMKTWSPRWGQIAKTQLATTQRLIKNQQSLRIQMRNAQVEALRTTSFSKYRINEYPPQKRGHSSHLWIVGEMIEDGTNMKCEVATQSLDDIFGGGAANTEKKGGVTLDGVFRPFALSTNANMAAYVPPTSVDSYRIVPTVIELDTFNYINDIRGGMTDDGHAMGNTIARPVGLRGPIIVPGWGMDTAGFPVPNKFTVDGGDKDDFIDSHRLKSHLWKAGPVDLRWDEERGVWVSDHQHLEGYLLTDMPANSTGELEVWRKSPPDSLGNPGTWGTSNATVTVKNRSDIEYGQGAFMIVMKINREWRPLLCCDDSEDDGVNRCYKGMGQDVEYDEFECLNEFVEDPDAPGGMRAPEESDDEEDIEQQQFTCLDDYMNTFEFVSNIYCIDDELIICTRKICLPNSWVSVEDCGDAVPPDVIADCCEEGNFTLARVLAGTMAGASPSGQALADALGTDFDISYSAASSGGRYTHAFTRVGATMTLQLYCDEDGFWKLIIGGSRAAACGGGIITATSNGAVTCETGQQIVFDNVTIPNHAANIWLNPTLVVGGTAGPPPTPNACTTPPPNGVARLQFVFTIAGA